MSLTLPAVWLCITRRAAAGPSLRTCICPSAYLSLSFIVFLAVFCSVFDLFLTDVYVIRCFNSLLVESYRGVYDAGLHVSDSDRHTLYHYAIDALPRGGRAVRRMFVCLFVCLFVIVVVAVIRWC